MSGLQYCRQCGKKNQYPVCNDCVAKSKIPCTTCGTPTPSITVYGKPPKRTTCLACTAAETSEIRSSGVICKVCREKKSDTSTFFQVCESCKQMQSLCEHCGLTMPKYIKRGRLRKYCSSRCTKLANPTTKEQSKKAQKTKWAGHVYKSHQNDIARGKSEYIEWRKTVYERDDYTCQKCGIRSGNGHAVVLHPHHIKPFSTFPDLRYEPSNGITLCESCHRKEHKHVFIGRTKKN